MGVATSLIEPQVEFAKDPLLIDSKWQELSERLDQDGYATIPNLISLTECDQISHLYGEGRHFRSQVHMARHGFGKGEYKYFKYPLPNLINKYREILYPYLAVVANRWNRQLDVKKEYPTEHAELLDQCHRSGQTRPTPLLLKYGPGDYNCLHQDIYGDLVFPLQVAVLLSAPGKEFTGGEFVITEQRPRMQSKAEVVPLNKGDAVVFAVNSRPTKGTRGIYRVKLRHGVSRLRSGMRYTVGIIFHDAV